MKMLWRNKSEKGDYFNALYDYNSIGFNILYNEW